MSTPTPTGKAPLKLSAGVSTRMATSYLEGRFVPTLWLALRLFVRYLENKEAVDAILARVPKLRRALSDLRRLDPALYGELRTLALREAVLSMPRHLEADQLAFLLGRLHRTLQATKTGDTALAVLGRVALTCAAVLAVDAPLLWVRGFERAAQAKLQEQKQKGSLSLPARRLLAEIAETGKTLGPAFAEFSRGLT